MRSSHARRRRPDGIRTWDLKRKSFLVVLILVIRFSILLLLLLYYNGCNV